MTRVILSKDQVNPEISALIGGDADCRSTVNEVIAAIEKHSIVIVGMRQNPYPKKACKLLDTINSDYRYLEYGSYFSEWKRRGAIKMWAGWQTFPMVFIKGTLIGGYSDLCNWVDQGKIDQA